MNSRLLIGSSISEARKEEMRLFLSKFNFIEKVISLNAVTVGSGQVHLSVELEFQGEYLIDNKQLCKEVEDIKNGANTAQILVKRSERMIRVVGEKINHLEADIKKKFPETMAIEIEIN